MNTLKRLVLSLLLKDKLIGQFAATAASFVAGYLVTTLGNLPELLKPFAASLLNLPAGVDFTPENLTAVVVAFLTTLFLSILNAITQRVLANDNNKVLQDLRATGLYAGEIDGWVGPVARQAVNKALDATETIQDVR